MISQSHARHGAIKDKRRLRELEDDAKEPPKLSPNITTEEIVRSIREDGDS